MERIIDGDNTLELRGQKRGAVFRSREQMSVRLLEMDTPEP